MALCFYEFLSLGFVYDMVAVNCVVNKTFLSYILCHLLAAETFVLFMFLIDPTAWGQLCLIKMKKLTLKIKRIDQTVLLFVL